MNTAASQVAFSQGSTNDDGYGDLHDILAQIDTRGPLFTTAVDGETLWADFLATLPEARRQHYNCNACRHFIARYANLVRVEKNGDQTPLLQVAVPDFFAVSIIDAICKKVRRAKIDGVFFSSYPVLGTPATGVWKHMHLKNVVPFHATKLRTAEQVMAEKKEEYGMLRRGLAEFSLDVVREAERVLAADVLYRSNKFVGPARWLRELHENMRDANGARKDNLVWLAVATAPPGWCHVRSTMVGTLLADIADGLSFAEVSRRFKEKMHPLQYQRPTAAPSDGQLAQAEKIIAELGAAGALRRRYAKLSDVKAFWLPRAVQADSAEPGVFAHLKTAQRPAPKLEMPAQTVTWVKFRDTVLGGVAQIEFYVPSTTGAFSALVTAVDPEAPPIIQWDHAEERNPVSWYFYHGYSPASAWNLQAGVWIKVTALALRPSQWGSKPLTNQGEAIHLLLSGCRDVRGAELCLFPEILKTEYHGIRKTIEAFNATRKIEGGEEAEACGYALQKGVGGWDCVVRVTDERGMQTKYKIDRWD